MADRLSHLDEHGAARMVDVGGKPVVAREAIAEGAILLLPATLRAIADGSVPKGDVLATARIAGIMAAKRCGELIPLCHPLALEAVEVTFTLPDVAADATAPLPLIVRATTRITAKTGVEMEALTAVGVAALTIYDMCKAIDKQMRIGDLRLVSKTKRYLASAIDTAREERPRADAPWTAAEDARLRTAVEDGTSIGHIAQALKRQPSAIRSRLAKLGIDVRGFK